MSLDNLAPPVAATSAKFKARLDQLKINADKVAQFRENAQASMFFDNNSPSTRKLRKQARAKYEEIVKECFPGMETIAQLWNSATFVEYSKVFLDCMTGLAKGRIGDKIRTDVLWGYKKALYWWAVRFIPDFTSIFGLWHSQMISHIHWLGLTYQLEGSHRPKSNLTSTELLLFYQRLFSIHQGVENWKQHYACWLLAYMVGVRPGSYTVCDGYEAGADLGLGPNKMTRQIDETLRWSDVKFFRFPDRDGIAVQVDFRYLKSHRNPYGMAEAEATKRFRFLPTSGDQYALDPAAILTGLAFSRGLFPFGTLKELHAHEPHLFFPVNEAVSRQAVFVASNQDGTLEPDIAMKGRSLNPKLKQMCVLVGLLSENSMYSFRRTAIIESRRKAGTEMAKELAGHAPTSNSIIFYDTEKLADYDMIAFRLDQEGSSRADIRRVFEQSQVFRIDDTSGPSLEEQLDERASAAMQADEQFVAIESELQAMLRQAAEILRIDPLPNVKGVFEDYRKRLNEHSCDEATVQLDDILRRRKTLRKGLMRKHKTKQKAEMLADLQNSAQVIKKQANTLSGSTRFEPAGLHDKDDGAVTAVINADAAKEKQMQALNVETTDDQDEDEGVLNVRAAEEALEGTREEPELWAQLEDAVNVVPEGDGDGTESGAARMRFIEEFAALSSVQNNNMTCLLCMLDPTVGEPKTNWTKSKLDKHLNGNFHSRAKQITRAAENIEVDGKVICPICPSNTEVNGKTAYLKHVKKYHANLI